MELFNATYLSGFCAYIALYCSKCVYVWWLYGRSRLRRSVTSSRNWSRSCAADKPKTTDRCMRAKMAPLKTSSQVGRAGLHYPSARAPESLWWSTALPISSALCVTSNSSPYSSVTTHYKCTSAKNHTLDCDSTLRDLQLIILSTN